METVLHLFLMLLNNSLTYPVLNLNFVLVFFFLQRGYRVKLDEQKFIVPTDRVDLLCAKNAAEVLNEVGSTPSYSCDVWLCFVLLLY